MLRGILSPSSGSALVAGHPAGSRAANRLLGLDFGTRSQLHLHMTVAQCLDLLAEIYYVTGPDKERRIRELATLFHVEAPYPTRHAAGDAFLRWSSRFRSIRSERCFWVPAGCAAVPFDQPRGRGTEPMSRRPEIREPPRPLSIVGLWDYGASNRQIPQSHD